MGPPQLAMRAANNGTTAANKETTTANNGNTAADNETTTANSTTAAANNGTTEASRGPIAAAMCHCVVTQSVLSMI